MSQSQALQTSSEEVMTKREAEQMARIRSMRKMSDFTWDYKSDNKQLLFIRDKSGRTFGVIDSLQIGVEEAERRANLFGASSEMLTALKILTPDKCPITTHHSADCGFCFALAVIAKAEGKKAED